MIYCDTWYSLMLKSEGSTQFVALFPGVNQLLLIAVMGTCHAGA